MGAKEVLAGKAVVEVGTRLAIQRGLKAAEDHFKKFGAVVSKIGSAAAMGGAAAVGAAAAAFAPLLNAAKQFADVGSKLDDMSQRTGAAVEGLSALGYAAKQSGTSIDAVEGGIKRAQKAIVEAANGSKDLTAAFQSLNLDVGQLLQMSPDAQFQAIAAAVGRIENPTQRAAMAMQLFGKSGTELLPLMRSNIKELTDEAARLGLVMSGENASAAAALGDAIDKMGDVIEATWLSIGAALAPTMTDFLNQGIEIVATLNQWIQSNSEAVPAIAAFVGIVGAAGGAVGTAGLAIVATSSVLTAMRTIASVVNAAVGLFAVGTAAATTSAAAFAPVVAADAAAVVTLETALAAAVVPLAAFTTGLATVALITGGASGSMIAAAGSTTLYGGASAAAVAPVGLLTGAVVASTVADVSLTTATVAATGATSVFGAVLTAVLSPIYAVVAAIGGSVTAMVTLTVAVGAFAAYVAYESGLIGDAFKWIGDKLWELVGTFKTTMSGMLSAMAAGQYVLAAKILWAGIKLAFWQGADSSLEAVSDLFNNALSITQRYTVKLGELIYKGFQALPSIMQAALTGGSVSRIIADMLVNGLDVGGVLDSQVAKARTELDSLVGQLPKQQRSGSSGQKASPQGGQVAGRGHGGMAVGRQGSPAAGANPQQAARDTAESLSYARAAHEAYAYTSADEYYAAEAALRKREQAFKDSQPKPKPKTQPQPNFSIPSLAEKRLPGAIAGAQGEMRTSSVGTFSAAAAGMIGGGNAGERVAGNTARTNVLLARMMKQRQRGPVYG